MATLVLNSVVALSIESRKIVRTRFGSVNVARAGRGKFDLVVVTPIGSAWMECAFPAELVEPFTIHVAELPGTGGSDASSAPEAASVAGVVAAISDISSAVASSTPVLFGHSMNGTLVLAAAAEVGCRGVIAVAPPSQLPPDSNVVSTYWEAKPERSRRERAQALVDRYEATSDEAERADLRQRFDHLRRWCDLSFDATELDSLAIMPTGWIASVSESGTAIRWKEILTGLDVPVFLALGEYDFVAPMTAWTHDNTPPKATVKVFHRSGHSPFVEEPAEFVAAVAEWAQQLDERAP
jgi:pimeloyl-ACP methyl ester carboxylesterase